jgi:hypothetical protein
MAAITGFDITSLVGPTDPAPSCSTLFMRSVQSALRSAPLQNVPPLPTEHTPSPHRRDRVPRTHCEGLLLVAIDCVPSLGTIDDDCSFGFVLIDPDAQDDRPDQCSPYCTTEICVGKAIRQGTPRCLRLWHPIPFQTPISSQPVPNHQRHTDRPCAVPRRRCRPSR